jgi:uncharacterized protein YbbC (DUF1343 family)
MEPILALVLCGIDVLIRDDFRQLEGSRVALITNHTGRTADGRSTIDVLHAADNLELVRLFAPEHGLRGLLDEPIADETDPRTGLKVYSLYNPGAGDGRFRPTTAQLEGVDTLVFDIQDIGTRFYTYVGTMGYAMEVAAEKGLRFVVLDRPNPVGGVAVEGPVADERHLGLTAYHPIALRHGMTAGELAKLFNGERNLGVNLEVIKVEGWRRDMLWEQTGLTWVNPSPNMRTLNQALLYPGVALIEASNVSVGRGTDTPFELIGAPWINGRELAARMNALNLPGVAIYPIEFTPDSSRFVGEKCQGIQILVTDRARLNPIRLGSELAAMLGRLYPEWQEERLVRLVQNDQAARDILAGGYDLAEPRWRPRLEEFERIRERYLIYR